MSTGLSRNTIDKFYTNLDVSRKCVDTWREIVNPSTNDIVIEPSAGNGSFVEWIKNIGVDYRCYDIDPGKSDIETLDFLKWEPCLIDNTETSNRSIHFIGNPPFGRQSSMAKQFIKHASKFAASISFILPRSFKKDSMQKTFPLHFECVYECDIPDTSFTVNDTDYHVSCVFQIWERKSTNRALPEKQKPIGFSFVKKDENPNVSFRRVGVYAGEISREIENKSIQSHYFIRFDSFSNELFLTLQTLEYKGKDHTVGPRSISKPEVIKSFNDVVIHYMHYQ